MDPELIKAGGWVFAAFELALGLGAFFRAVQTGSLVPGALLMRALDQMDKQIDAQTRLTGAVEAFARETSASIKELRDDVSELRGHTRRRD